MCGKYLTLFIILFAITANRNIKSQDMENEIKSMINDWIIAWEKKDIDEFSKYLTQDYEYYGTSGERLDKSQRLKKIKQTFKDYKWININTSSFKFEIDSTSLNDVKVIFTLEYKSNKYNDKNLKTLRVYKGDETKWRWKIYREISDVYVYSSSESNKNVPAINILENDNIKTAKIFIIVFFFATVMFMIIQYIRMSQIKVE